MPKELTSVLSRREAYISLSNGQLPSPHVNHWSCNCPGQFGHHQLGKAVELQHCRSFPVILDIALMSWPQIWLPPLNKILIEVIQSSIRHSVRFYLAKNEGASLLELAKHALSLTSLLSGRSSSKDLRSLKPKGTLDRCEGVQVILEYITSLKHCNTPMKHRRNPRLRLSCFPTQKHYQRHWEKWRISWEPTCWTPSTIDGFALTTHSQYRYAQKCHIRLKVKKNCQYQVRKGVSIDRWEHISHSNDHEEES